VQLNEEHNENFSVCIVAEIFRMDFDYLLNTL
jgi:hypothetical protein